MRIADTSKTRKTSPEVIGDGVFSQVLMSEIFQIHPRYADRLNSREHTRLEFKKAFSPAALAEYARTCAAYANAKGGYIVFGVGDKPHKMIGLQDKRFEELDPQTLSTFFSEHLAPEIHWSLNVHEFEGLQFGVLHVREATAKPVVCARTGGRKQELKEGEIYYRYRGQTTTIHYPELREIIEDARRQEHELWLRHLSRIARIGVREAGVFDTNTGVVSGPGGSFVIDERLLPRLKFIKEGEFQEITGAPAIRVVGDAKVIGAGLIQPVREVTRTKAIRTTDIVHAFLNQEDVADPEDYIRQICFENAGYLPVYCFIKKAGLSIPRTIEMAEKVNSRAGGKRTLLKRLLKDRDLSVDRDAGTESGLHRAILRKSMIDRDLKVSSDAYSIQNALLAVRTLDRREINPAYLFPLLKTLFDKHYSSQSATLAQHFREAFCYLDATMYRKEIPND